MTLNAFKDKLINFDEKFLGSKSTREMIAIFVLSCLAYFNVVSAPFLHDDNPAILNNPDVQGKSNISSLWKNDFWGTPLQSNNSHKSFRPLTVLFFRLIHAACGNWSTIYHATNIILHSAVSVLFYLFCHKSVFSPSEKYAPFLSGLIFGLHPIHTEAVCGIVGCAELLSAFWVMLTLSCYKCRFQKIDGKKFKENSSVDAKKNQKNAINDVDTLRHRTQRIHTTSSSQQKVKNLSSKVSSDDPAVPSYIKISFISSLVAMLCKESGITILGIIFGLDIINELEANHEIFKSNFKKALSTKRLFKMCFLIIWGACLLLFRFWIMEWSYPVFKEADNPLLYEKNLKTRFLTQIHIYWYNFSLLLFPVKLCYDYSFSTIPKINLLCDSRNVASSIFVVCMVFPLQQGVSFLCEKKKPISSDRVESLRTLLIGYILLVVPFLPAANLFFPVGFVVAERVLYLPSAGFILVVVFIWHKMLKMFSSLKYILHYLMLGIVVFYFVQVVNRSKDWTTRGNLFRSGVNVAPQNAKIRYNWANYLRDAKRYEEAIEEYEAALRLEPFYVNAINNLGTVLEETETNKFKAEELYARAIRTQPNHDYAYNNLAKLLIKQHRHEEASKVLLKAIRNVPGHLTHVTSLAEVLMQRNKLDEAERVFDRLLQKSCFVKHATNYLTLSESCPQSHFSTLRSYSKLLLKKGEVKKSLYLLNEVVERNPNDAKSMVLWAKALLAYGDVKEATRALLRVNCESKELLSDGDIWTTASELHRGKHLEESKQLYEALIKRSPQNLEAVSQYDVLLFELEDQKKKHS